VNDRSGVRDNRNNAAGDPLAVREVASPPTIGIAFQQIVAVQIVAVLAHVVDDVTVLEADLYHHGVLHVGWIYTAYSFADSLSATRVPGTVSLAANTPRTRALKSSATDVVDHIVVGRRKAVDVSVIHCGRLTTVDQITARKDRIPSLFLGTVHRSTANQSIAEITFKLQH